MPSLANPSEERTGAESNSDATWRLRWYVGDLAHHTEWTTDFGSVENLAEQYRRADAHPGHDYTIERRTRVARVNEFHPKPRGAQTHEARAEATHYAAAATEDPAVPDRYAAAFKRIAAALATGGDA